MEIDGRYQELQDEIKALKKELEEIKIQKEPNEHASETKDEIKGGNPRGKRKSSEHLWTIFETMAEGIALNEYVYNEEGKAIDYRILDVNRAFYKIGDFVGNEVIGRLATELYKTPVEQITAFWRKHKGSKEVIVTEMKSPITNKFFYISTSPIDNGKFVVSFLDITDWKKAEEDLKNSRNLYQSLVRSLPFNIYRTDLEGRLTFVNKFMLENYNVNSEKVIGHKAYDFYPPEIAKKHKEDDQIVIQTQKVVHISEEELIGVDGSSGYVEMIKIPVFSNEGQIEGIQGVYWDVTERIEAEQALKESESRLAEAQKIAKIGNWEWNVSLGTLFWSNEVYNIFGVLKQNFQPSLETVETIIHPDDLDQLKEFRKSIEQGKKDIKKYSHRIVLPNGSTRWVQERIRMSKTPKGEVYKVFGTIQDITELKEAEQKITESEVRYRALHESLPVGVIVEDAQGEILSVNDAACKILKTKTDNLLGAKSKYSGWNIIRDNGSYFTGSAPSVRCLSTGKPVRNILMGLQNAKQTIWISINCQPLFREGVQEPYAVITSFNDITERKKAEFSLLESEKRFRRFMENVPAFAYIKDNTLNHIYHNQKVNSILKEDENEKASISAEDIFNENISKLLEDADKKILEGEEEQIELEYDANVQGGQIWLRDIKFSLTLPNGTKAVGGLAFDITELKRYQRSLEKHQNHLTEIVRSRTEELESRNTELHKAYRELFDNNKRLKQYNAQLNVQQKAIQELNESLRQSNEELSATNEALNDQTEQLEQTLENLKNTQAKLVQAEKMVSLGALVAGVAHEINNPVNFIGSYTIGMKRFLSNLQELTMLYKVQSQKATPEMANRIRAIEEKASVEQLFELFGDALAGIDKGVERTAQIVRSLRSFARSDDKALSEYDVHENIDDTLVILKHQYKNRIEIKKNYGEITRIQCYAGQINQVWMNLLSNAIHAISGRGEVSISTYMEREDIVCVSIKDNGCGIPSENLFKIFDPFFTTKEVGKGTGLGLSIVYNIVQKHRAEIHVESKVGVGTEFKVYFLVNFKQKTQ